MVRVNEKTPVVLIADDEEKNLSLVSSFCEENGYTVIIAHNGSEAVELATRYLPDIILTDVIMPVMDGFEATRILKDNEATKHIPIIIITSLDSKKDMIRGISSGANDLLQKPFDKKELFHRISNNLKFKEYQDFLKNHNSILQRLVAEKTKALKNTLSDLESAHAKVKNAYIETILRLTLASEYKDEETGSHIKRVGLYAEELALALGMDSDFRDTIGHAAPMHDIGKVGIPDSILLKSGGLNEEEWNIMKSHTVIGAQILKDSESPYLTMGMEIAHSHHERWDGKGYPQGLKGNDIPLPARIMNIVDQYDALRSKRPYKAGLDHDTAVYILFNGDGRTQPDHFDPLVLNAFKRISNKFLEIFESCS